MAKFLGVITNSKSVPNPSDDRVLEFTDLDLLANFLLNETENLIQEFQLKVQFSSEREISIHENMNKITQIYELYQVISQKTLELEMGLVEIDCWLRKMENLVNCIERLPKDYAACKCTSNAQRSKTYGMLVTLSEDMTKIESQAGLVEEQAKEMPKDNLSDFNNKMLPFLDLHTKILENIELKINKISDASKRVDEMFINAHRKLSHACYHKPRHEYASDC